MDTSLGKKFVIVLTLLLSSWSVFAQDSLVSYDLSKESKELHKKQIDCVLGICGSYDWTIQGSPSDIKKFYIFFCTSKLIREKTMIADFNSHSKKAQLVAFNCYIKAGGNGVLEYNCMNENATPEYVLHELRERKRFLVLSGYLKYKNAKTESEHVYKFMYQVEAFNPDEPLVNKYRIVLSENIDI